MVFILRGQATRTLWLKQKSSKCDGGGIGIQPGLSPDAVKGLRVQVPSLVP